MNTGAAFVTFVPAVAILVLMLVFARGPWNPWRILGAALILVFLGLLTVARLQLGNSFSVTAQARRLVVSGLYARIRHPVYVFSSFLVLGAALYLQVLWLTVLLAVIVPLQVWRARQEEKVLTLAFGEAYQAYRKTTWF